MRIIKHEFHSDFSSLRNFALSQVKTDWVFFLDSDEEMSEDLVQNILKLIEERSVDGYWISRRTYLSPKKYLRHGLFYPDYQLRLFRVRPEYVFVGAVHEIISIPQNKTRNIRSDILHFPRNPKYTSFSDFHNLLPYIKIEAKTLKGINQRSILLILTGIYKGTALFLSGFFRGKGFLDGWAGFRAHVIFALSVSLPYFLAAKEKVLLK